MKYIICDIDGVLADCSHRLHYIEKVPKDWDGFFEACSEDKEIKDITDPLYYMNFSIDEFGSDYTEMILVTGRPERIRNKTIEWMEDSKWLKAMSGNLILMRKDGDHRKDYIVKLELVKDYGINPEDILVVIDDSPAVIEAWIKLGVKTLQVR